MLAPLSTLSPLGGMMSALTTEREMAKNIETPPDLEIAALKKQVANKRVNLMEPGPGTPWEDRGSVGIVGSFFKTVTMSMSSPRRLMRIIRRPETLADARVFTIICGVFWGLGWAISDYVKILSTPGGFDFVENYPTLMIHFGLGVAGTYFLLNLVSRLMHKLISAGTGSNKAAHSLVFNVFAYGLGPSLVAIVPFGIGPGIALVWIIGLWIIAGGARLGLTFGNALVCVMMSSVAVIGGAAVAYWGVLKILSGLGYI